jgi:hypothetical protein
MSASTAVPPADVMRLHETRACWGRARHDGKVLGICVGCDLYRMDGSGIEDLIAPAAVADARGTWQCPNRRFSGARAVVEVHAADDAGDGGGAEAFDLGEALGRGQSADEGMTC